MQRHFRLTRSADFERLRHEGKSWRHPLLTMAVAPNGLDHNRYGFIVSRRSGSAVVRNRVRRVMREVVRLSLSRIKPGFDISFIARNEIVNQPYSIVSEALETLFKRAGLWEEQEQS
jgi:ribonuclease P protein component